MKATCINTKEVILSDPLDHNEVIKLIALANNLNIIVEVSQSGAILIFKCDDLHDVFSILSELGAIEDIGSLKEIIDWKLIDQPTNDSAEIIQFKPEKGTSYDRKDKS
jgi:hypothetical protein|tara:strand:- start:999 stop:1322 length:324 start_codon:yes stop_codon:yes gene_type:complete